MAYLTYTEYEALVSAPVDTKEFDKYLVAASDAIDSITSYHYQKNDLESDIVAFRKYVFKKAIAYQLSYMAANEIISEDTVPLTASSWSMGSTSVSTSKTNRESSESSSVREKLDNRLSVDAYQLLEHSGLLYRGVAICG